jgi:hypothetical protein
MIWGRFEKKIRAMFLGLEHPRFEKNRKLAKIHIPHRARDSFSNGFLHFAENRMSDSNESNDSAESHELNR